MDLVQTKPHEADTEENGGVLIRRLGLADYESTYTAMRRFTEQRSTSSADELWLLQHPQVYTLGQAGKIEHLLRPNDIPVVHVDRGGQITYHGPGQIIAYVLLDLRARDLGVRSTVALLEQAAIDFLGELGVKARRKSGAPGVYVDDAKIAALGLRVRNGSCYHGIALNVDLDLRPFDHINPCGYAGMPVTRLADLNVGLDCAAAGEKLATHIVARLAAHPRTLAS